MIKLKYSYKTRITFSENVYRHHFLLRCAPSIFDFQKIIEEKCVISPNGTVSVGRDSFGNLIYDGYIGDFHNYFEFEATGIVEQTYYSIKEELNPLYLYPSKYTQPMKNIQKLLDSVTLPPEATTLEKVVLLSAELRKFLAYESGVTSIQTTAEEALEIGKGVCQDFSHILIALCRKNGIPARYVSGFMQGEGFTHAWIEYHENGVWYGFDPTHDRCIETGYIKIAHGRDYSDCALDKGVFTGLAQQKLEVFLKVEEQQQ